MRELVELGDLCDFVRGVTFGGKDTFSNAQPETLPILRAGNIGEELEIREDLIWVPANKVSSQQKMKEGDIAICMSSGSSSVVGKTAQLKRPFEGSIGAFCGIVRPKTKGLQNYLPFWFRSSTFTKWRDTQAKGANIQNLRFSELASLPIPLPPTEEQQRIAATLERADHLRRTRRFARQMSDSFLQSVFLKMFGNPSFNPRKFDRVRLQDLFSTKREGSKCGPFGGALKKEEFVEDGVPVWVMDNIVESRFVEKGCLFISPPKFKELSAYSVETGDIIVSRAGTVGKMCVVNTSTRQSIISTNLIRLSLDPNKILPIFFVILMTRFGNSIGKIKTGQEGAYTFMNTGVLSELEIPLPPIEKQREFAAVVQRFERLRAMQIEAERQAQHLFGTLLHQAFSG